MIAFVRSWLNGWWIQIRYVPAKIECWTWSLPMLIFHKPISAVEHPSFKKMIDVVAQATSEVHAHIDHWRIQRAHDQIAITTIGMLLPSAISNVTDVIALLEWYSQRQNQSDMWCVASVQQRRILCSHRVLGTRRPTKYLGGQNCPLGFHSNE